LIAAMEPRTPALTLTRPSTIRPGSWEAWRIALRPRTLWIATMPVIVATCLAWTLSGAFHGLLALTTLGAAVLMQVVTNLQNDVGYTERGGETGARVGLPRATANGWLTTRAVKHAIVAAIALTLLAGLPLVIRGGWPIAIIGLASIAAAWAYMGGRWPIAYTPLGELTVFTFFGLAAVCGSYYVQAGTLDAAAWIAGSAVGMHAAAVLLVNNFRDRDHDLTTGRRTLAIVHGREGSLRLYALLLLLPFALVIVLALKTAIALLALPLFVLPWAWRLSRALATAPPGQAQNALLFRTVLLEVAFGLLLSAGALAHGIA
jgi:1,4-dihydroxy-2-naphthoate octaprenyltransferase